MRVEARGFHQQVLVRPGASLLFLLRGEAENEARVREPLRRIGDNAWQAGPAHYTTDELLHILDAEPERLSPNALLRPVFQDAVLPTAANRAGRSAVGLFQDIALTSLQTEVS